VRFIVETVTLSYTCTCCCTVRIIVLVATLQLRTVARYEETMAGLQKITDAGHKIVSISGCKFRKLLCNNPGLENDLYPHPCVKNSPINIRCALYAGRTDATKKWYTAKQVEGTHYVDVISLYPYICKYGKSPVGHPEVHVGADCPADCLERKASSKVMFCLRGSCKLTTSVQEQFQAEVPFVFYKCPSYAPRRLYTL
jgi:hypothetical protein